MEKIDEMSNIKNKNMYDLDSKQDFSHLLQNESCLKAPMFHRMMI